MQKVNKENKLQSIPEDGPVVNESVNESEQERQIKYNIQLLHDAYEKNKSESKYLFLLGLRYSELKDWNSAYSFYTKRVESKHIGNEEERFVSLYKRAIIAELYLNLDWQICHQLYLQAFHYMSNRAEPLLLIADHFYRTNSRAVAYLYIKRAAEIPYPVGNLVEERYYKYDIPRIMANLCYENNDFKLGEEFAKKAYSFQESDDILEWCKIYEMKNKFSELKVTNVKKGKKPVVCFVTDGSNNTEPDIPKVAENFVNLDYNVYVFWNCDTEYKENKVNYVNVSKYLSFISEYYVDVCIISKYNLYLPVSYCDNVQKVYYWLHDTMPKNNFLILNKQKFKGTLCLTEENKKKFNEVYKVCPPELTFVTSGKSIEELV